ncbi:MAG: cytochrome c-type biogenesis CcmF C-terminal domain-containing protein, partial [Gammaproteobacteria bacterium]
RTTPSTVIATPAMLRRMPAPRDEITTSCNAAIGGTRDARIAGATAEMGGYQYRFVSLVPNEGPNYSGVRGEFIVSRDGKPVMTLHPEKRQYWVQRSVQTEAGIGTHWGSNVLIALGEDLGAGKWSVRLQVRPLVNYVWIAAFIMALGGAVAASDKRYRLARASDAVPAAGTAAIEGKAG